MNLEGILLNFEIMQAQNDKYCTNFIYMWNIKQLNLQKQRVAWRLLGAGERLEMRKY